MTGPADGKPLPPAGDKPRSHDESRSPHEPRSHDESLPPAPPAHPAIDPDAVAVRPPDPPVRVPLALEDMLGAASMIVLVAITFGNVVARYLTSYSFAWTEEISIAVMVIMTLAAASAAIARDRHIRIDYFLEGGGAPRRRRLVMFGALVVCAFFALLTVLSGRVVWDDMQYGETSPGIGVPIWWYSAWTPLLSAAICGRALGVFLRARRGDTEPPSPFPGPELGPWIGGKERP
ncbi:MAG: TRAP transporter small permease [Burkholderiaceae bacterium]